MLQIANLSLEECIQTCGLNENNSAQVTGNNNKLDEQVDAIATSSVHQAS